MLEALDISPKEDAPAKIRTVPTQLTLSLGSADLSSFYNFYPGANKELVQTLESVAEGTGGQFLYLWGQARVGKTHLLQALCCSLSDKGYAAAYIPLSQSKSLTIDALEHLEQMSIVCVDDIHMIAGNRDWEEALFDLYNRLRDANIPMVVTGKCAPTRLGIGIADLSSRLAWGLVYQLHDLDDNDKLGALRLRANARGFELPVSTGRYLLKHVPRDMASLFEILDQLDHASLENKRKLTIPFIREFLLESQS